MGVGPSQNEVSPDGSGWNLPKIVKFSELCRCGDEVWIECGGKIYRLRRTKQGKLVLTK